MYLKVTLDDGSTALIGVSPSHTIQVIDPKSNTAAAWAVGGIKEVSIEDGDIVGTPVEAPGGSEADPLPVVAPAEPAPVVAPSEPVVEEPVVEPAAAEPVPADAVPAADAAPADPAPADAALADGEHDAAVASVTQGIADVAAAPDGSAAKAAAKASALTALQADIDAALAQWPDSQQLQDAKAQADALATS